MWDDSVCVLFSWEKTLCDGDLEHRWANAVCGFIFVFLRTGSHKAGSDGDGTVCCATGVGVV